MFDPVHVLSLASILVAGLILLLGTYVLGRNRFEPLNQVFFFISLGFAVWSFACAFWPTAPTKDYAWFWYRLSSLGWAITPSLLLHFLILLSRQDRLLRGWWSYALIYAPGVFYFLQVQFGYLGVVDFVRGPYGWSDVYGPMTVSFAGFLLYFSTYISFGMMLVFLWGLRTERRAERRQSQILTLSGVPVLGAVALSGIFLPMWGIRSPPDVAHLIAALWVLSIWIAVSRYRLMILNPETVALDIFKTMADAAILVDRDDQVVNLNKSAEALLGASEEELRGTRVEEVFETEDSAEAETVRRLIGSADRRALELGLRRQSGELVTLRVTVSQIKDRFAQPMGSVLIMRDISDQKRAEADLKYLTTHDPLTDLPNRSLLHDRLQRALQRAIREKRPFALLTFDLDDFQQINDAYGPQRGDLVLQEVARRLSRCVRGLDTVCRLGGDEFIVLVEDLLESGDSDLVAQRILDSFEEPIDAGGQWITVTGSIGISTYPFDGLDTETLVKKADLALGSSKRRGRSGYQYYAPRMDAMNRQRVAIEQGLQEAIGENELYLVFQPLVDFATGTIAGIEALCRWQSKKLGSMSPASFIPIAERSGLIVPIGEWVLETACRAALRWREEGLPAVPIGVNVSARQLLEPNFLGVVDRVLEETGLRPDLLELELTETTAMEDVNRSLALLTQLQDKGIQIVIDDFGTGYSSLMRLKQLPMNTVKVDRSFINNIARDPKDRALVMAIVAMARNLGVGVVAEGVETLEQLEVLRSLETQSPTVLRCDRVQGYLFSRPVDIEKVPALFALAAEDHGPFASVRRVVAHRPRALSQ